MADTAAPEFITRDANQILTEMVTRYQELTGKTLQPGQPEYMVLTTYAYREFLLREQANGAAVQNLVRFAVAPILDYLGDFVGVKRLAATPAGCTLHFVLNTGHGIVTIDQGTRISSQDGKVVFECLADTIIQVGVDTADVEALCLTDGTIGNGYLAGTISTIIDPLPFVASAANLGTTAGGADDESDAQLRDRIILAPSSFSVAGPRKAYIFWTKSAHPSIIDAEARSLTPGSVTVWPLVTGGIVTPVEVIDAVEVTLDADQIRPLTDTVIVESPTIINYTIDAKITLYTGVVSQPVVDQVTALLQAFVLIKQSKLGVDVTEDELTALVMKGTTESPILAGTIYKVEFTGFADQVIAYNEFAVCTDIDVTVIGTNEG